MESAHLRERGDLRCFVEDDVSVSVLRRSAAEGIGTFFLMFAVVGSNIHANASQFSAAVAISGSLIGLILAFGAVSGGHFNPTITLVQLLRGQRGLDCTMGYLTAQVFGAVAGALAASAVFMTSPGQPNLDPPTVSALASEGMATFGLMTIVFSCMKSTSKFVGPFAVGLWLSGAIMATPTGAIANPAVAIGLLVAPGSVSVFAVAAFVAIQFASGILAAAVVSLVCPDVRLQ